MTGGTSSRTAHRRVVILGGGASGVLLALHLLRDKSANVSVTIIERRDELGRGVAVYEGGDADTAAAESAFKAAGLKNVRSF